MTLKIVNTVRKLILCIICLIFLPALHLSSQDFVLNYSDSNKSLTIQSDQVKIKSEWISPSIQPVFSKEEWKHVSRVVADDKLSGLPGSRTTDLFSNQSIEIERQVWLSNDKKVVALRQIFSNRGKDSIRLQTIVPLACNGLEAFQLKGNPEASNWKIMVQKRFKNDLPETVVPKGNTSIKADPCLIIPVGSDPNGSSLLIGYLNWTDHLAHLNMTFKNENGKTVFNRLYGNCEFNEVTIPPKGERTTQWIYITVGQNVENTINEYADRVGKYHNVPVPPKNAPSLYCSWYYYSLNYNEEFFKKDLQAFRDHRMPFDVFLIDECWDVLLWGDFMPNKLFPGGMKDAADKIKELGYKPGIWTCPYLVDSSSNLAKKHPEWVLKTSKGDHYIFKMNGVDHWVFDLTYPGVLQYIEESFRRISEDWGYQYFKFDFMRAVVMDGDYKFYNPLLNRLEAYRMGLEAIRRGVGDDAYISVCGGHYGGSLGIANSQRSGSDVVSYWDQGEIPKYRQNIFRTWMSRLWHVDPDAMMVRRSELKLFPGSGSGLTLGRFTDKEAQVNTLNQYIGGGLVTFTEDFAIIDEDRRALYKHIIPSVNSSSFPIDWYDPAIPSMMVTKIDPVCAELGKWNTLSMVNWSEQKKSISFDLDDHVIKNLPGNQFLLFEFFSQEVKGIYKKNDKVILGELDPHAGVLIKIIPWNGRKPVLAGTNLHFSMGGVEIKEWEADTYSVEGTLITEWLYPVIVTAVFPAGADGFKSRMITLQPNQKRFWIELKEK